MRSTRYSSKNEILTSQIKLIKVIKFQTKIYYARK